MIVTLSSDVRLIGYRGRSLRGVIMARKNHRNSKRIVVTREVASLAALAMYRADARQEQGTDFLPGRVMGSRRISRRMLKALREQAA